ncbi:MAG: tol-pal system protein YbgF [Chlorobiaceae bacterium]|nr:tol-pal system protein YbgF [Chlorobiaceae bacterium]
MNQQIKPFLFLPFLVLSACATKQDLIVVEDDVRKLKTESETIKTQSAGSYSDVQKVHDDISSLQGSMEESAHKNREAFGRIAMEDSLLVHKVDELESRLQKIEHSLGLDNKAASASTASQPIESAEKEKASVVFDDAALLKEGLERLGKKSFAPARESFTTLLKNYPKSALADQAQFYLAGSFFSEKWYEKAILEYQVVIAKYTKSSKRPAALFKQAIAFEKIGDEVNAKARFKTLVNVYPKAPEAALARKKIK